MKDPHRRYRQSQAAPSAPYWLLLLRRPCVPFVHEIHSIAYEIRLASQTHEIHFAGQVTQLGAGPRRLGLRIDERALGDFQFFRVRGSPFMEGFNALESVSSRFDGVLLDGPIVPKGNQLSCHLQTHAVDLRLGQCDLGLCRDDS